MRHWQPIHHERWRSFVESLAATLRGELPASATPPLVSPLPVFVAPSLPTPSPVAESAPEPAPVPPEPVAVAHVVAVPPSPTFIAPIAPLPIAETPPPPATGKPVPHPLTARAFFSALGWTGGAARFTSGPPVAPAPAEHQTPVADGETTPQFTDGERQPAAGPYFRTLPWDGRHAPGDTIKSIRVTAAREDNRLDPRTASLPADNLLLTGMLSAARTSDRAARNASRQALAGAYFHDLPWSRQPDHLLT